MFPTKLGKLDLGSRIYLLYMKDNISFAYQIALTSKLVLENKQIPMFFELQAVLSLVEKKCVYLPTSFKFVFSDHEEVYVLSYNPHSILCLTHQFLAFTL